MASPSSHQKRALILPALLSFSLGVGMLPLKVSSDFFTGTAEHEHIAEAARSIKTVSFIHPFLATSLVKDPAGYERQCAAGFDSALVETRTWMLIQGPTVEVCLNAGKGTGKIYEAKRKK
jgi:hypothetical protein